MMQRVRPIGPLIKALMDEAGVLCANRGGFGYTIRRQQRLMLEAALTLAKWGRKDERRKLRDAQPEDLLNMKGAKNASNVLDGLEQQRSLADSSPSLTGCGN